MKKAELMGVSLLVVSLTTTALGQSLSFDGPAEGASAGVAKLFVAKPTEDSKD